MLRAAEIVRLRDVVDLTLLGNPAEVGERIALKLLRGEIAAHEGTISRFREELRLARRIIHHRENQGPFQKIDDLLAVPGMGRRSRLAISTGAFRNCVPRRAITGTSKRSPHTFLSGST